MVMECDYGGGHFLEFRSLTGCTVRVGDGQFYYRLLQLAGVWMDYCVNYVINNIHLPPDSCVRQLIKPT